MYISVGQKDRDVLDILSEKYKGSIYTQKKSFVLKDMSSF